MHQQLMQVAMTNLSLVRGSTASKTLLQDLADLTGIPFLALLKAEKRMTQAGSLMPLRELFANPTVLKAERLRYRFTAKRLQRESLTKQAQMATLRLKLDVESVHGRLQIVIDMTVKQQSVAPTQERQTARIAFSYQLQKGGLLKTSRQAMTVNMSQPRMMNRVPTQETTFSVAA